MKLHALLIVSVGLLIAADAKEDAKKDTEKMQGTWIMISGEEKGEKLPEKTIKNAKLTIKGDKYTVNLGDDTMIGTQKIDSTKKPKEIDATGTEGPKKGTTILGIYKLDGDEFTVCFAPSDKDRPKEFTSKSGTGSFVHVWKKQKK